MIKVYNIDPDYMDQLLKKPITPHEEKFVLQLKRDREIYPKPTTKKYVYFWLIFNKYFDRTLKEQKEVFNAYGRLKETTDAFKDWKYAKHYQQKLERAKQEEDRQNEQEKKGDKYFS